MQRALKDTCKDTWKRKFKLPWREASPLNHQDDKVDSDQLVVNENSFCGRCCKMLAEDVERTRTCGRR